MHWTGWRKKKLEFKVVFKVHVELREKREWEEWESQVKTLFERRYVAIWVAAEFMEGNSVEDTVRS